MLHVHLSLRPVPGRRSRVGHTAPSGSCLLSRTYQRVALGESWSPASLWPLGLGVVVAPGGSLAFWPRPSSCSYWCSPLAGWNWRETTPPSVGGTSPKEGNGVRAVFNSPPLEWWSFLNRLSMNLVNVSAYTTHTHKQPLRTQIWIRRGLLLVCMGKQAQT